jgi:hypothetical protein
MLFKCIPNICCSVDDGFALKQILKLKLPP